MIRVLFFVWSLMATSLRTRFAGERGATAVEYGLMVAAIAAIIVGAVFLLGENVLGAFNFVNDQWQTPSAS